MKIGLNATCFNDRPSGAKHRFIGIYTELFKYFGNDEFIVYEPSDCPISPWFDNPENVVFKRTPLLSNSRLQKKIRGGFYWRRTLRNERLDLFECFHQPVVFAPTGRTLLTIHDIRRIVKTDHWHWRERLIYKAVLDKSLKSADHLIVVSESTRNQIHELFPEVSASVIYNGIDIELFQNIRKSEMLKVRKDFNLPEVFILAVGHFEKRKNYLNLIEGVNCLRKKGNPVNLVIIGNDSGEMATVKEGVRSLKLSKHVKIYSGLTDLEVRCFYKLCNLFVFPSSYEGFGIPILEAMAAGCPIVLSDIAVFQEITQGRGAYFSHSDPESIANVIDRVLSSDSEKDRIIDYGNKRIQDFSFKKIAKNLAQVYTSLA